MKPHLLSALAFTSSFFTDALKKPQYKAKSTLVSAETQAQKIAAAEAKRLRKNSTRYQNQVKHCS